MSSSGGGGGGFLNDGLSQKTSIFGLRLWVVIGIGVGALIVLILFSLSLWLSSRKRSRRPLHEKSSSIRIPMVSKEILVDHQVLPNSSSSSLSNLVQHQDGEGDGEKDGEKDSIHVRKEGGRGGRGGGEAGKVVVFGGEGAGMYKHPSRLRSLLDVEKACPGQSPLAAILDKRSSASADSRRSGDASAPSPPQGPEVSHLGWGHWYTLRELEMATEGFCDAQVLGEGGYGIVYRGRLPDGTVVAVKNLLNNRGQAEKEFKVEVEVIGRVRHKNLVRLIGYCVEGSHRMLVYEYVDNGNLDQWLHGPLGEEKPLNWENRMKIILGTAKGLAYLHEGLEPKVVHRDVKSSNILLDTQWHPKVSDFGLAKLLGAGKSHVTTRVMGTFGYVAPEYASTGLLNERSDVYSFGVLLMEVITGREPVDYVRPAGEVNLVDWLKTMVGNRRSDEVADPRLEEKPAPRVFKRALLVALRCVDPDSSKRPKMGQVVHMLEADDYPFRDDRRSGRGSGSSKVKDSPGRPPQFPSPDTRISPSHAIKDSPARRLAKIDDIEEELVENSLGHKSQLRRYEF